jgi:hypothetical protein
MSATVKNVLQILLSGRPFYYKTAQGNWLVKPTPGAISYLRDKIGSIGGLIEHYGEPAFKRALARRTGKRTVEIEIGKPGTYEVNIRTIKMVRVFQIKADKLGNVGLFV